VRCSLAAGSLGVCRQEGGLPELVEPLAALAEDLRGGVNIARQPLDPGCAQRRGEVLDRLPQLERDRTPLGDQATGLVELAEERQAAPDVPERPGLETARTAGPRPLEQRIPAALAYVRACSAAVPDAFIRRRNQWA